MCPNHLYFSVPALAGFNPSTGETICEENYGLILGDRVSSTPAHCDLDAGNAFQGVKSDHYGECSRPRGRFGIIGDRCHEGYAGWNPDGTKKCVDDRKGLPGLPGGPGLASVLPAQPGPPGPAATCDCIAYRFEPCCDCDAHRRGESIPSPNDCHLCPP